VPAFKLVSFTFSKLFLIQFNVVSTLLFDIVQALAVHKSSLNYRRKKHVH
jgi:hypothetical protein